ncbi:ArsR/SmtB family transcription factor [Arthrobacter sp. B1I2]|uniref:ArsR/SmtB family transcription factor n=1 Tax=Arthrobacter sp. B1I2 TaxID=3042263 RepID=UPI0027883CCA|nr:metalloregulator ArsR/SmtB family transcription factor [Arthrobacter sp. B1I2]MDQ0731163.1 DNA-binding transcriptional ArsR family regulator [Arthrobacter sp. B1I2]
MSSYDIGIETRQAAPVDRPVDGGSAGPSMLAAAELFKAVAHPVRATILELLSRGELSIPQLCDGTGVKPTHLSRHLAQMRSQQLIECVRSGGRLVYRLTYPEAAELLGAARSVLQARITAALNSLGPMPEEEPFTAAWGERISAPEAALVSRSAIADACQAIAERTGCTVEAAAGRLIMTARTCHMTLLEAALDELRTAEGRSDG